MMDNCHPPSMGSAWRSLIRDMNRPETLSQLLILAAIVILGGICGMVGYLGGGTVERLLGAAVFMLGVALMVVTGRKFRRR